MLIFFDYLQKSIMKLYPDAAPVKGKWVIIKCDSGPGRLNPDLLASLRYHGFLLYPSVPNTAAVSQETDQSFGPFQSAIRSNLQLLIDEQICKDAPRALSLWIVGLVVFSGCDPETGLIVASAFEKGFSKAQNICAWEQVGDVSLSRKCLQSPKVRCSIGDGDDDQQVLVHLIVEHNVIACNALTMECYNGDVMKITLKPIEHMTCVTPPHMQDRIELLSLAKSHGNIFAATVGVHLTSNDIFMGIVLKQRKILHGKLAKEKTLHQRQERTESNALAILEAAGGDATKIKGLDLTILRSWHQHPKVAGMKKEEKLSAWVAIVNRGKAPSSFEKWTNADDLKLLEAQSDIVEMAHTALGHLEALKKKELVLVALTMTQEEFDKLAADRNELIVESSGDDHPTSDAPIPANELGVALSDLFTDESFDTSGNDGGVMGEEGGV